MSVQLIHIQGLNKPLRYQTIDAKTWVDVRSICETLSMSWSRWAMFFSAVAEELGMRAAEDEPGRPTWFIEISHGRRLFLRLSPRLATNRKALKALVVLRTQWTDALGVATGSRQVCLPERGRGTQRKVTALVVRRIFQFRQQNMSWGEIGQMLGISGETVRVVGSGRYRVWDQEAAQAWDATFGSLDMADAPTKAMTGYAKRVTPASRKLVDAATVEQIHGLHQQRIAPDFMTGVVGLSATAIRSIISGRYKFASESAKEAWDRCFKADSSHVTGGIGVKLGGTEATPHADEKNALGRPKFRGAP